MQTPSLPPPRRFAQKVLYFSEQDTNGTIKAGIQIEHCRKIYKASIEISFFIRLKFVKGSDSKERIMKKSWGYHLDIKRASSDACPFLQVEYFVAF